MKIVVLRAFLASNFAILMMSQSMRLGFWEDNIYWHTILPALAVLISTFLLNFVFLLKVKVKPISTALSIDSLTVLVTIAPYGVFLAITANGIFIGVFASIIGVMFSVIPVLLSRLIMTTQLRKQVF